MNKEELITPLMGLYQETISDLLMDTDTVNEEEEVLINSVQKKKDVVIQGTVNAEEERVDVAVSVKKQRSHQQL